jgi:hypothetical protein
MTKMEFHPLTDLFPLLGIVLGPRNLLASSTSKFRDDIASWRACERLRSVPPNRPSRCTRSPIGTPPAGGKPLPHIEGFDYRYRGGSVHGL